MTGPQAERKRNVNAEHKRKTQNARHPPCVFSCPSRCSSIALHLMLASSSGVSKCFLGFQGSRKDFAQQKLCGIISGLPQRFCAAKALWDNFRAPAKIAWRVLWEEERQAYQVMRQTKRAADQTALPRRGGLFAACELGNGILSVPFQGSRADAKQMRGKRRRKPSGQAARNAAADLRALRRRERGLYRARRCQARNEPDGRVVDPMHKPKGVISSPQSS